MAQSPPHTSPDLFAPIKVGPLHLKNRVVMAPLTRSRAAKGNVPTALNALYYAQRASAGLIISEPRKSRPRVRAISRRRAFTVPSKSPVGA